MDFKFKIVAFFILACIILPYQKGNSEAEDEFFFPGNEFSHVLSGGTISTDITMLTADSGNPNILIERVTIYDENDDVVVVHNGCLLQICRYSIESLSTGIYLVKVETSKSYTFSEKKKKK